MAAAPSKRKGASCNTAVHISQLSPLQKKKRRVLPLENHVWYQRFTWQLPSRCCSSFGTESSSVKKAEQLEANRGLMSHDMSQGALKKKREYYRKGKGHCAQCWTGNLEACADGAAEIVTRASSTSHDNPVAEFGGDCNLQLLRWDSKQATTCTMLASWCSLWLKLYSDFFGGDHAWKLSGTKVSKVIAPFHRDVNLKSCDENLNCLNRFRIWLSSLPFSIGLGLGD